MSGAIKSIAHKSIIISSIFMKALSSMAISHNTSLPLDLKEVKTYLKITNNYDDELLNNLISSVVCRCENYTGLSLITKTWRADYPSLNKKLLIPFRPLKKVNKITILNSYNKTEAQIIENLYSVLDDTILFHAALPYGKISVQFEAGFGDKHSYIPLDLKLTMTNHVAFLYEERGNQNATFSMKAYNDFRFYKI